MWKRFSKDDKAFTGLEAAIVLVAFVVVAAVFSYVMLGAGFYTTQKSQEVVHTGVQQASSSLVSSGDVIVGANGTSAETIYFYVANTAGGSDVDLNKTLITYLDKNNFETEEYNATTLPWKYEAVISTGASDNLVKSGEKYKIMVNLANFTTPPSQPGANEVIKLEIKPPEGAVLVLERTMPPALSDGKYYPVY